MCSTWGLEERGCEGCPGVAVALYRASSAEGPPGGVCSSADTRVEAEKGEGGEAGVGPVEEPEYSRGSSG